MQILVDVTLKDRLPKQCEEWNTQKEYIRDLFMREQKKRESDMDRDIANTEGSLQHTLREEVVDHVIGLFPYVVINHFLTKRSRRHSPDTGHWIAMGSLPVYRCTTRARELKVRTQNGQLLRCDS